MEFSWCNFRNTTRYTSTYICGSQIFTHHVSQTLVVVVVVVYNKNASLRARSPAMCVHKCARGRVYLIVNKMIIVTT